jgi:hypothetical protein
MEHAMKTFVLLISAILLFSLPAFAQPEYAKFIGTIDDLGLPSGMPANLPLVTDRSGKGIYGTVGVHGDKFFGGYAENHYGAYRFQLNIYLYGNVRDAMSHLANSTRGGVTASPDYRIDHNVPSEREVIRYTDKTSEPKSPYADFSPLFFIAKNKEKAVGDMNIAVTRSYEAYAANVRVLVAFEFDGTRSMYSQLSGGFPNPKVMVEQVLARMKRYDKAGVSKEEPVGEEPKKREAPKEYDASLEAFPYPGVSPGDTCLVPASEALPAKFVIKGAKPGATFSARLQDGARGELEHGSSRRKTVSGTTDASGKAVFFYRYRKGKAELTAQQQYPIAVTVGGKKLTALVRVGLGLAPTSIRGIKASTVREASRENTFIIAVGVESRFQPGLHLINYLSNANNSGVWGDKKIGMKMVATWMNDEASSARDERYVGPVAISALPDNRSVLTATKPPWYSASERGYFYPAVVMGKDGVHIYRIDVKGAAIGDGTAADYGAFDEKTEKRELLLTFSKESPETVLTSLTCAFNAKTDVQYLMLETVKALPGFKQQVDAFLTTTSLVCGLLQGEYEKSLLDLGAWTGGKVLDHLSDAEVLGRFTIRQQKAIKEAKKAYDKLDKEKKKREIKELHSAEGSIGIPPQIFDIDLEQISGGSWEKAPAAGKAAPAAKPSSSPWSKPAEAQKAGSKEGMSTTVQDIKKSFKELGDSLKSLFK